MSDTTAQVSTRARRHPPTLSTDLFVAAAIDLIEERGFAALTMRDLSTRMGVAVGAAYRHIPDKDALLLLVTDAILGQVEIPQEGTWYERLVRFELDVRTVIHRYPGVSDYIFRSNPSTAQTERLSSTLLALLHEAGLDDHDAGRAHAALTNMVAGDLVTAGRQRRMVAETEEEIFVFSLEALLRGLGLLPRSRALRPRRSKR